MYVMPIVTNTVALLLHSNWDGAGARHGILLSLDLHKAFDSLSWPFLFHILRKWNCGPTFLTLQTALYSNRSAKITRHGPKSDLLHIRRGTRQGCPLSPLLFVIAIETLAIAFRSSPNIHSISSGGITQKCALFTNDLLFITNPITTLSELILHIVQFWNHIGFRVNQTKSKVLNVNL